MYDYNFSIHKILDRVLFFFDIPRKATPEQAKSSHEQLRDLIALTTGDAVENRKVVYGYVLKKGLVATRISSYAIGFCDNSDRFVIVPVDPKLETQAYQALHLDKESLVSVTATNMRHEKLFVSPLLKDGLRIITPHYTRSNVGTSSGMRPIVQTQEVTAFERMLQQHYEFVPRKRFIRREWL